jgi:hypothetical protein
MTKVASDPRADDGRRIILLGRRTITIKRRLRGMKMHLSVPVETYQGVVMAGEGQPDGVLYRVTLTHRDPDLSVTLKESRSRGAMVEAWHQWSTYFAPPVGLDLVLDAARPGQSARVVRLREVRTRLARGRCVRPGQKPRRHLRVMIAKRGGRRVTPTP